MNLPPTNLMLILLILFILGLRVVPRLITGKSIHGSLSWVGKISKLKIGCWEIHVHLFYVGILLLVFTKIVGIGGWIQTIALAVVISDPIYHTISHYKWKDSWWDFGRRIIC